MKRVALYLRVSTDDQTVANQRQALTKWADYAGHEIVVEFADEGISGAKGRDKRPQFDALHKSIIRREIDLVATWSVDRLGRNLSHLVGFLEDLHNSNVDLFLHQQGIDTTTPTGKAMFQMLGVFSDLERSHISDRVKAGLDRARASGKRLGRPKLDQATARRIDDLRAEGVSIRKIARAVNVSPTTVQAVLKA